MIDALFTLATYVVLAVALLGATIACAVIGIAVWDWFSPEDTPYTDLNEYQPLEDWSAWEDWDWPVPDDNDSWDFPERTA